MLLLLSTMRFGDATHPGPSGFTLGALTATGLQGKHSIVSQLPPGLCAASETHLTSRGVAEFNKGLHFSDSSFKLLPGAPSRHRQASAYVGEYTGVGFLSTAPMRAACHSWHEDVYATSRLQVAIVDSGWSLLWLRLWARCSHPPPP